jgi:predicted acylesterase/phospholipase RssA
VRRNLRDNSLAKPRLKREANPLSDVSLASSSALGSTSTTLLSTAGFVAGGGGALGSAHLGVYKAFSEAGAVFDVFGETSAGAAVAAALAMGLDAEDIDARTHNIFVTNRAFRRFTLPYYGLLDHKAFDRALRTVYGDLLIEDLWRPFFAISANLADRNVRSGLAGGARLRFYTRCVPTVFYTRRQNAGRWRSR